MGHEGFKSLFTNCQKAASNCCWPTRYPLRRPRHPSGRTTPLRKLSEARFQFSPPWHRHELNCGEIFVSTVVYS